MKFVSVQGYLHPLTSQDHEELTATGYAGTRIPEGALSALYLTLFKGKIARRDVEVFVFSDVLNDLLQRWVEVIPFAVFRAPPTSQLLLDQSGLGVRVAVSTVTAQGNVYLSRFDRHLANLRHYLGRYSHTLTSTYVDQPNGRVFTLRAQHVPSMACVHFYTLPDAPVELRTWHLSSSYRIVVNVENIAGNRFMSLRAEELTGDTWHSVMHRSFPFSRLDKDSLSDMGTFLIALSAN